MGLQNPSRRFNSARRLFICPGGGMADALDLRSSGATHEGSTPSLGTKTKLFGFLRARSWAAHSAAHWFCGASAPLCAPSVRAFPSAKTRFEPNKVRQATFFAKRLPSCAILGRDSASFIHSAIGSSLRVRFCKLHENSLSPLVRIVVLR